VTFRVVGAPITSYSNWRYQFQPIVHPDIVRAENINTGSWMGPLLRGGRARVVVIVPGHSVSISLESSLMTVNPRAWNTSPKPPEQTSGIGVTLNPPGIFLSPSNQGGHPGYSVWDLLADFDAVKLDGDGPNKGLSYVTQVRHADWPLTYYQFEISPDYERGTTFYSKQCGQGGFILGSVLRANIYEHESGTQKGHYQQYRDKLAEPTVNYAKYAEPLWGSAGQAFEAFEFGVAQGFADRRAQLNAAAVPQACNAGPRYDVTCMLGNPSQGFRGNINYFPFQPPCQ
jgi:hypothetical protein